jgi:hypothetical protein
MKAKTAPVKVNDKNVVPNAKHPELKTEGPLSEKDEVKQAETRTNKPLKRHL